MGICMPNVLERGDAEDALETLCVTAAMFLVQRSFLGLSDLKEEISSYFSTSF